MHGFVSCMSLYGKIPYVLLTKELYEYILENKLESTLSMSYGRLDNMFLYWVNHPRGGIYDEKKTNSTHHGRHGCLTHSNFRGGIRC